VESQRWALLKTDLAAQQVIVDRVFAALKQRSIGLSAEDPEKMESTAYQRHNLYGAIEGGLKIVATHFENNISDTTRWHSLLLQRMTQPVQGIRPAVISADSYELLNALRAFRHFFRHAYGVAIDFAQLHSNLDKALRLQPILEQDIQRFLDALDEGCRGTNGK
jgi:hypothetical protein